MRIERTYQPRQRLYCAFETRVDASPRFRARYTALRSARGFAARAAATLATVAAPRAGGSAIEAFEGTFGSLTRTACLPSTTIT